MAAASQPEQFDPVLHFSNAFQTIRTQITRIISLIVESPWETLTNIELQYLKFVMTFLQAFQCPITHGEGTRSNTLKATDRLNLQILDINVKIAYYLQRTHNKPNDRVSLKVNEIRFFAQRVVNLTIQILNSWPEVQVPKVNYHKQRCIELLFQTLQTRCALAHFYMNYQGAARAYCMEKYARVVHKLNQMLAA